MNAASFTGRLLRRGDAQYDTARALHNGLIDKHPALIAQCRTARDVVGALALAAGDRFAVTVRGGGHNVAGRVSRAVQRGRSSTPRRSVTGSRPRAAWSQRRVSAASRSVAGSDG